ncbi:hypothetical protein [Francisella sp. 19X1-34]|uniref:hypothetical protein n=1 Tax=Francisella sp. 19X1-34 TaxID=3087177 RepID=UPI002E373EC1|nr:hypothetical protein [Francisella sp. 19X1-34]MED7787504.1 hypothetical protein [Francisella sp. 19X1-34]
MRKKIIFFCSIFLLNCSVVLADTTDTSASIAQTNDMTTNDISSEKQANTDKQQTSKSDDKPYTEKSHDRYGDDLSVLVDTSNASYDALLADAEKILADRDVNPPNAEIQKRIQSINGHVNNVVVEKKQMKKDVKAAGDILKRHDEINQEFKNSYGNKSAKDYIAKETQGYNDVDDYQMKNYKNLLDDVKLETPEQIGDSFDEIDDSKAKSKYKLSDGYSIEDVTTVGALTGQNKRLKKCLIMKTYGGGTWRTYCQPLKKPTQCPDYDWNQLSTMAIMYC